MPAEDTLVFNRLPGGQGTLLPGASHCASERFKRVLWAASCWLNLKLRGPAWHRRLLSRLSQRSLL